MHLLLANLENCCSRILPDEKSKTRKRSSSSCEPKMRSKSQIARNKDSFLKDKEENYTQSGKGLRPLSATAKP